jgi:hypothetical protein
MHPLGKRLLVRPREQREPRYQGRNAGDRFEELAPIHEVHPPLVNIEAQYSLGRFRSRHYDMNLAKLFLFEGRRVRGVPKFSSRRARAAVAGASLW